MEIETKQEARWHCDLFRQRGVEMIYRTHIKNITEKLICDKVENFILRFDGRFPVGTFT